MKAKCVRCEILERPQKSRHIYLITNAEGEKIPLCAECVIEVKEEEDFFKSLRYESGSEGVDQQLGEGDESEDC